MNNARRHPSYHQHQLGNGSVGGGNMRPSSGGGSLIPEYLWRLVHTEQMDLESTYSQMVDLFFDPKQVYKTTQFRHAIKKQWARDDPAFVAILVIFILVVSLSYCLTYGVFSFGHWVRIVLGSVCLEFIGAGVLAASFFRYIANRYMHRGNCIEQVEWMYAFDIHCNGFLPALVILGVFQFFLSPLLIQPGFLPALIGNALYALSLGYYQYVTFLGYSILPFLDHTTKFLLPIGLVAVGYVLSVIFQVNLSQHVLNYYFGSIDDQLIYLEDDDTLSTIAAAATTA